MPDVIITYETLYELLRREKSRKELQKLDPDFFQRVTSYLEEKKIILNTQKESKIFTSEKEKTKKQLQNIKKIIQQLFEKRESKILESAVFTSRSEKPLKEITINMLPEEKEFYESLTKVLSKNKEEVLINLLNGKNPKAKTLKSENNPNLLIRFIESVPKFIGLDGLTYGPFEKEDIANIPSKIASIIIKKNRAEKIENET